MEEAHRLTEEVLTDAISNHFKAKKEAIKIVDFNVKGR